MTSLPPYASFHFVISSRSSYSPRFSSLHVTRARFSPLSKKKNSVPTYCHDVCPPIPMLRLRQSSMFPIFGETPFLPRDLIMIIAFSPLYMAKTRHTCVSIFRLALSFLAVSCSLTPKISPYLSCSMIRKQLTCKCVIESCPRSQNQYRNSQSYSKTCPFSSSIKEPC